MAKKGMIVIDENICKSCELCIVICPKRLIKKGVRQNSIGYNPAIFDDKDEKCTACMFCGLTCPEAAIEIFKICDCANCDCKESEEENG
jgi:2-oxoglutarate ferredoxin oxidoreductase subunit delta